MLEDLYYSYSNLAKVWNLQMKSSMPTFRQSETKAHNWGQFG